MMRRSAISMGIFVCGLVPGAACAQVPPRIPLSPHGEVAQRVAWTDISISYNRPSARGRVLYGDSGIVKWGRIWHPGADSASRITFSKPVTFEGAPLAAGTYSFWTIPQGSGPWTVILSKRGSVFHTQYPGEGQDALRVPIAPERGEHMESLAYYFAVVARDSTVLRLHWGETILPMHIRVSTDPPD